ncbi:MAG TPA: DUF2182 domain-containing protein, partial [Gemmatimonadaceae bacterium]|nr:DUF2182 domain-containing protein [Gemmatimonadaceae bacterium]
KARRLAGCGEPSSFSHPASSDFGMPWRYGVRLGIDCARCCIGLMAIPLVVGIMDLRVMGAVAVAITAERLAPAGMHVARGVGVASVGAGVVLLARAAGLG